MHKWFFLFVVYLVREKNKHKVSACSLKLLLIILIHRNVCFLLSHWSVIFSQLSEKFVESEKAYGTTLRVTGCYKEARTQAT
jgi:hypothetical protein